MNGVCGMFNVPVRTCDIHRQVIRMLKMNTQYLMLALTLFVLTIILPPLVLPLPTFLSILTYFVKQ